jgi:ubiquinol-cytochrome c reductase cytochrome b/c1 subunit/ubiquinol-cytochrome c reductase cytochrome c1 subunit
MKILSQRRIRTLAAGLTASVMMVAASSALAAGSDVPHIEKQSWTFGGLFGAFDKDQLRRGYMVYKNVCASCHGMKRVHFRNLKEPGGPEYTEDEAKAFAKEVEVTDGPNDEGEMFKRKGRLTDAFPSPYKNDKEAAFVNNGSVPPDLSLMGKARGATRNIPWYMEPLYWVYDIATVYQEQGPDYIYALLTSYGEPPVLKLSEEECSHKEGYKFEEGTCKFDLIEGLNYNIAFPGHQIAMVPPLFDDSIEWPEGTAPKTKEACEKDPDLKWLADENRCSMTASKHARDVAAFLMWTAEPKLEARKSMGLWVMLYVLVMTGVLYLSKRALWRKVKH